MGGRSYCRLHVCLFTIFTVLEPPLFDFHQLKLWRTWQYQKPVPACEPFTQEARLASSREWSYTRNRELFKLKFWRLTLN
jgi:hypothetical protein